MGDVFKAVTYPLDHFDSINSLDHEAYRGNVMRIRRLIDDGYDINQQNNKTRNTPLMRAARMNHAGSVRLLLSLGANPNLKDNRGKTALDQIRKLSNVHYFYPEIIAMLEHPEDYECSICFEENYYGEVHSCRHSFHSNCINNWHGEERENGINPSCPMCRSEW